MNLVDFGREFESLKFEIVTKKRSFHLF